jgi:hypothetical protein
LPYSTSHPFSSTCLILTRSWSLFLSLFLPLSFSVSLYVSSFFYLFCVLLLFFYFILVYALPLDSLAVKCIFTGSSPYCRLYFPLNWLQYFAICLCTNVFFWSLTTTSWVRLKYHSFINIYKYIYIRVCV